MLNTLIESRGGRRRNTSGTVVAVVTHAVLIGGAAYATATAATTPDRAPTEIVRIYSPPAKAKPVPQKASSHATPKSAQHSAIVPRISVNISPTLPPVDIPLADPSAGTASDFPLSSAGAGDAPVVAAEPSVYDAAEVESEVAVVSGFRPEYPAALRAAGIEGRVVAQFVVTIDGKTDRESIRILSATNDLFAASVRQALIKSVFRPARIGSKRVPQLVQQLFVFKLDR